MTVTSWGKRCSAGSSASLVGISGATAQKLHGAERLLRMVLQMGHN